MLKISGLGDKLLDVHLAPDGTNAAPRVALALVDPATGFRAPLAVSFSGELLAAPKASEGALLQVILLDAPFDGDQILVVDGDLVAPALAKETEPNDDFTTANRLTTPVMVTAALDRKSDVDVFALSVTTGTLVVRTLPNESVKSPYKTDTKIDVFDADGRALVSNDDEQPNSPFSFATVPVRAGTVFIRISSGADAFTEGGAYRLAALVR